MLGPPIALQALGNLGGAGANACVLHLCQHIAIAFAGDNRAQDLLTGFADDVGEDVGELVVACTMRTLSKD